MTDNIPPKPANLINAVARNQEAPDTFEIPDRADILEMTIGDFAKIGLVLPEGTNAVSRGFPVEAERFWVKIEGWRVEGDEVTYYGKVANEIEYVPDCACDDTISFGPEHVLQILEAPRPKHGPR
jgi:hypothetical protein